MEQAQRSAQSRRDILKKSALVGAAAWTAPLVMSSPAFAATTCTGGSQPCTRFFYRKIQDATVTGGTGDGGGTGCANQTPAQLCSGTSVTSISTQTISPDLTGSETDTAATICFPPGAVPLHIQIKPGGNCGIGAIGGPGTYFIDVPSTSCRYRVVVQGPGGGCSGYRATVSIEPGFTCQQGISHINVYFCL